jgi:hypothetical protein
VNKRTTKSSKERTATAPIVRFGFETAFEVTACNAVRMGRWIVVATIAVQLPENPASASVTALSFLVDTAGDSVRLVSFVADAAGALVTFRTFF